MPQAPTRPTPATRPRAAPRSAPRSGNYAGPTGRLADWPTGRNSRQKPGTTEQTVHGIFLIIKGRSCDALGTYLKSSCLSSENPELSKNNENTCPPLALRRFPPSPPRPAPHPHPFLPSPVRACGRRRAWPGRRKVRARQDTVVGNTHPPLGWGRGKVPQKTDRRWPGACPGIRQG